MNEPPHGSGMCASVVIATRNRHADLTRCVAALHAQVGARGFEIVIVDDGGSPPLDCESLGGPVPVRVLRTSGVGPAAARNAGVRAVRSEVVLFTDDDTVPSECWVAAAVGHLWEHPADVGVAGQVCTPPYDPLFAYSISSEGPGHYWTCNVGYRRAILTTLRGFDEARFPYFCEDLDLAFRSLDLGPIGYAHEMSVIHTPRNQSVVALIRQGRTAASQIDLAKRHPTRVPSSRLPLPAALVSVVGHGRNWERRWQREREELLGDPRRLARFLIVAAGHMALVVAAALRSAHLRRPNGSTIHR